MVEIRLIADFLETPCKTAILVTEDGSISKNLEKFHGLYTLILINPTFEGNTLLNSASYGDRLTMTVVIDSLPLTSSKFVNESVASDNATLVSSLAISKVGKSMSCSIAVLVPIFLQVKKMENWGQRTCSNLIRRVRV